MLTSKSKMSLINNHVPKGLPKKKKKTPEYIFQIPYEIEVLKYLHSAPHKLIIKKKKRQKKQKRYDREHYWGNNWVWTFQLIFTKH